MGCCFDELDLPGVRRSLSCFAGRLVLNGHFHALCLGEARDRADAVLIDALNRPAGDPDIERAAGAARHHA